MDTSKFDYHPVQETIVGILNNKMQNQCNNTYHRVLTSWFFSQMATNMHCKIKTEDRGTLPVNMYAILTGVSGLGKTKSMNIMEEYIVNRFKDEFLNTTFRDVAEKSLTAEAYKDSNRTGEKYEDVEERLIKEFQTCGEFPYSFDSGTPAAFKQIRTKAQIAKIGALSLIIDEMGNNLLGNTDLFAVMLETYDKGLVKAKITKNTAENTRGKDRTHPIPVNLLCYGTPAKLFDGGKVEMEFNSMEESGYARRCYHAVGVKAPIDPDITAEDRFKALTSRSDTQTIIDLSVKFGLLADAVNYNKTVVVPDLVSIEAIRYQLFCEKRAEDFPDHDEVSKAEMIHRYFKALKTAGAYAFIDGTTTVNMSQLHNSIKLTEESGSDFGKIMCRDKPYVKLAKHLASTRLETTHADLAELPFYTGTAQVKKEMLMLAIAYGYKNNIIIKRLYTNGVEILMGESLIETDLEDLIISVSTKLGTEYTNEVGVFNKLSNLTQSNGYHWCNHYTMDETRREESMVKGFNMVIIDVDEGIALNTAQLLLRDYTYHMYTTKRHRKLDDGIQHGDRFRIILPISHVLKLDSNEFKEFMNNVYSFLPFDSDTGTNQRSKKWQTFESSCLTNEATLLDALQFIPKTEKNEERESRLKATSSLTNIERWFAQKMTNGNRSNEMIKYAMMLVDSGRDLIEIQTAVMELNDKLVEPLPLQEIMDTILKSVAKAMTKVDD
jgi:hypothetical protein